MSVAIFCGSCGTWTEDDEPCVCNVEKPAPVVRSVPFCEWASRFVREAEVGTEREAAERVARGARGRAN